ncbi:MAG TPA: sigma-70 family RNA polymerase sigma factor [Verrucomicrobiae bacterium]|nr:sigma-70 family RNA polymerase sigma factor [Verrucomicrobiae bacterium]
MASSHPHIGPRSDAFFLTTRWTVVLTAREQDSRSGEALETLCRAYWYPLYAFIRRQGSAPADAEDLTQGFFARFLEKHYLKSVNPDKGKFRSFLLASLKHFLANERDRVRTKKRGGGAIHLSLDAATAETRYLQEPIDAMTPEKIFDREWALTLLELVLARLRRDFRDEDKAALFEELKVVLTAGKGAVSHAEIAAKLGMSEGAVKVAAHRMRRRYRELLKEEIAQTVTGPEQVEEEIRALFSVFSSL